jgi:hypothetical protein
VGEAAGGVVEEVDGAVLVAGGRHVAVGGEVDGEREGAFGFVGGELGCGGVGERGGVVDVDAAVVGGGGQVLAV